MFLAITQYLIAPSFGGAVAAAGAQKAFFPNVIGFAGAAVCAALAFRNSYYGVFAEAMVQGFLPSVILGFLIWLVRTRQLREGRTWVCNPSIGGLAVVGAYHLALLCTYFVISDPVVLTALAKSAGMNDHAVTIVEISRSAHLRTNYMWPDTSQKSPDIPLPTKPLRERVSDASHMQMRETQTIPRVVSYLLFFACAYVVLASLLARRRMRNIVGSRTYMMCFLVGLRHATRSNRVSWMLAITPLVFIVAVAGFARHFLRVEQPWENIGRIWPYCLALLFAIASYYNQSRPPLIIVLGHSTASRLGFHARLLSELYPFRTVGLMQLRPNTDTAKAAGHVYRISEGSWEPTVSDFINALPLVVIDLRDGSEAVSFELAEIIRQQAGFKTICITESDRPSELAQQGACFVSSEDGALAHLLQITSGLAPVPQPEHPIAQFKEFS